MAKPEANADLDLGEEKSGKKKIIILIVIITLLLIGGGVAGYFLLAGNEASDALDSEHEEQQEQVEDAIEKGPAQYHEMNPVFIVNLPGQPSLLQVGVNVRITSDEMIEFIKHNDPMIRHHLLNLLQQKDAKKLTERAAKEALQREMLNEVNRIVKELSGPGDVDALYFTSFVMQ